MNCHHMKAFHMVTDKGYENFSKYVRYEIFSDGELRGDWNDVRSSLGDVSAQCYRYHYISFSFSLSLWWPDSFNIV